MRQRAEDALLSVVFDIAQYTAAEDCLAGEQQRLEQALADVRGQAALVPTDVEADQLMNDLPDAAADQFQAAGSVHQWREPIRRYVTCIELWPDEIKIFSGGVG